MTSYAEGSATNYDDLLTKLRDFLTADATLVAAGENWSLLKEDASLATYAMTGINDPTYTGTFRDLYLRGPGLAATDNVYVNIRQYQNSGASLYNWMLSGATGFDTNDNWEEQEGIGIQSSVVPSFPLSNSSIDYIFVANGRRFIVVVTISGDTYFCYCGLIVPYATPSEYPYPLLIAGTSGSLSNNVTSSDVQNITDYTETPLAMLRLDSAIWQKMDTTESAGFLVWPWSEVALSGLWNTYGNLDGSFNVVPGVLYSSQYLGSVHGELEGVYYVPKGGVVDLTAGDTITIGSDVYFVLQNGQRTVEGEYCAIKKG
jgi:hypothetical protein